MTISAKDISDQVPNAGTSGQLVEGHDVVIRRGDGAMVWAGVQDEKWCIFSSETDLVEEVKGQTAPEIARALVKAHQALPAVRRPIR